MYIGVDYYPEHWPSNRWTTDADLMAEAGFNIARLAEFAWVDMEPVEGEFEFGWLDEALSILGKRNISAILGTPTAVMPAWMAHQYPETLAMQKDGTRIVWGVRKNNCFTSSVYRKRSERITLAMAEHFAQTPNVIGWQTDNEFGQPYCYCDECRGGFQTWLQRKYGSLDELNRAWGNHFWGQKVQGWDEIVIPVDDSTYNPSACLDWRRFFSWLNVSFQRDQVNILRKICPTHFITHNFMGLFKGLNYYELATDLDFVSWDNYPKLGVTPQIRYDASLSADVMRGLKGKNFWIMEQTAGAPGWATFGRNPRPGEIRSIAYQQLAHGADGNLWFRWRTCTAGREQYWHGLLGHDGRPLRRYDEAAQVAHEYHRLAPELEGTTIKADVAIIYDYESLWALDIQPGYSNPEGNNVGQDAIKRYYQALFRAGVNVDMVPPSADLTPYKLVLAPHLYILSDTIAEHLNAYVRAGGVLLTDCRTAVKDETSLCYDRTLPGKLSEMLGISIEEYEAVIGEYPLTMSGDLGPFTATHYADWVHTTGADVLASYASWHLADYAAVTRHRFGKGWGWYVGTVVKETKFYDWLAAGLLNQSSISPIVTPPAGVEVSLRERQDQKLLFLLNHTEQPQDMVIPEGCYDLLKDIMCGDRLHLDRYGVAILKVG